MRDSKRSYGRNGKDEERKLSRGSRDKKEKQRRSERGWSTLRVIKSRPSRSPLHIHPDFIYPPCIQRLHAFVCAVVKTHTTLTWLVPRRSRAQSDAAWRRRREVDPALLSYDVVGQPPSEEAASSWRVPGRSSTVSAEHKEERRRDQESPDSRE